MSTSIEAGHQEYLKEYLIEGYKVDNPDLPSGICVGCSVALSKKRKDNDFPLKIRIEDYDPKRPLGLRSITSCSCNICHIARMSTNEYRKIKRNKAGRPVAAPKRLMPDLSKFAVTVSLSCIKAVIIQQKAANRPEGAK